MNKIAIVILNWNNIADTLECIRSVHKLQGVADYTLQIVVVDNGSSQSINKLKKEKEITLIHNKKNLGFAGGNNVGIKCALENGADYVMILNNDTVVNEDLVVQLIKVADLHKDAGILSPKIYFAPGFEFHKDRYEKDEQGKVIWYAGGIMDWDNVLGSNRGVDEVDIGRYNKIEETDFATGACILIKRQVLEGVGFFDEKYFMYLEDADLALRAKKAGWKVLYVPNSHLWHKVAGSSGIGSNLNDYFITRNRMLFGLRYASIRAKFALFRESAKLLLFGREWQRQGVIDFYLGKFGKGSWK